jgi:cob(I)alamin adenosyltransferase
MKETPLRPMATAGFLILGNNRCAKNKETLRARLIKIIHICHPYKPGKCLGNRTNYLSTINDNTMESVGINIVLTGNGKGKTTSAMGMVLRALGQEQRVCVVQFIKSSTLTYGEITILNRLGVENFQMGAGFTWVAEKENTIATTKEAWELAVAKIFSNQYDLIVLDEINHVLNFPNTIGESVVAPEQLVDVMNRKPQNLTLVLTGRYAHPLVIGAAHTVSDIQCVKHHYQQGIVSAKGIEY